MALPRTGSDELLYIHTDKVSVTIKGQASHPDFQGIEFQKKESSLNVICDDDFDFSLKGAKSTDPKMVSKFSYACEYQIIPLFYEQQRYEVIVEAQGEHSVAFVHENYNIQNKISQVGRNSQILSGIINFGNEIGLSDLIIMVDGKRYLRITIEVFPSKISYKEDYQALIADVTAEVYGLVFDFLKETYTEFGLSDKTCSSPVEFFSIIRTIYNDYIHAADMVLNQPHHALQTIHEMVPGYKAKRVDKRSLHWLQSHPENAIKVQDVYSASKILAVKKQVTYNTKENQLTKHILLSTIKRLQSFKVSYSNLKGNDNQTVLLELDRMINGITRRCNTGFMHEVDAKGIMEFVSDYFSMDYMLFIRKYFYGDRTKEINRSITPERYNKLFDSLSPIQRRIIDDDKSKHIVVAAGPGSGKTKVLVHKLASLLLLEDVKSEQLLMLTFSRSAATEFKQRLINLIGDAAFYVEIKTFHSYCFNLLGQIGNIIESENVVPKATAMIRSGEVDQGKITKTVLVLDEAQDMNRHEFSLVEALMEQNEDMRVIAVGDDDQNVYEFRASDSKYLKSLITDFDAVQYEMLENYRSDRAIVDLANKFAESIENRLKTKPITAVRTDQGIVKITKYTTGNLIVPTLNLIRKTYKGGTSCVMTVTNDEALLMTGILKKSGYNARLIQSNDGFNLSNLYELRCFVDMLGEPQSQPVIPQDVWDHAMELFQRRFSNSSCLPECLSLLQSFDETNKEKYHSDLIEYIQESTLEELTPETNDIILVSTIHKSKGREFDSVYMMLNNYRIKDDSSRHVVYVGLTRAKKELYVNCNTGVFDGCNISGLRIPYDRHEYPESEEALFQLSLRGVNLGFFKFLNNGLNNLYCGQLLTESNGNLYATAGSGRKCVAKLSKSSMDAISALRKKGFEIYKSEIRFLVYWKGKNEEKEVLCVLPNIYLRKNRNLL